MSAESAVVLAPLVPLVGAVLIWLSRDRPDQREAMTLLTACTLFAIVAWLTPQVVAGARPGAVLVEMVPGIAIAFAAEPLGILFALVASGLWIVTSIYSIGYMRAQREPHQTRFYACFAVSLAAAIGVAFAANLATLFAFYELLTLATYPLVTHRGNEDARAGGRVYLGLLLSTSTVFFLLAIVLTYMATGSLDFTPGGFLADAVSPGLAGVLVLLYAFGIGKAALMPFHRWLPAAMVAPAPVSALLHAVAVVKAGVFTVLKVVVYVFGIDFLAELASGRVVTWVAAATIVLASIAALMQDNLKARLAYSTVSQLSYIVLGAMLANSLGIIGGAMHIATHAFGKITLFFCAGAIYAATGKIDISQMRGIGRAMPVTMGAFFVASLSIVGLPPLGGLWSKWVLVQATLDAENMVMLGVLLVGALLSAAYLLPVAARAFFAPRDDGLEDEGIREGPLLCVIALTLSALGALALFAFPDPLYRLLGPVAALAGGGG